MGRKGGSKGKGKSISNVKKANLKRHKLVKAGKLKPKSTPRFVEGGHLKKKTKPQTLLKPEEIEAREKIRKEDNKIWEKEAYAEMAEMMDPEDLEYLRQVHKKNLKVKSKPKDSDAESDDEYEGKVMERHQSRTKAEEAIEKSQVALLPIRTKDGKWVNRSRDANPENSDQSDHEEVAQSESSEDEEEVAKKTPVSVVDILAKRRNLLAEAKIQIGSMASSFLEQPEERMPILQKLLKMMGGKKDSEIDVSIQQTVTKLASATLLEIFKDTVPNYKIKDHEDKTIKLKKDTLKLQRFETELLNHVKNYLAKLSKFIREGSGKGTNDVSKSLAKYSLQCLCQLFATHPNFNFTNHILQFLIPFLNAGDREIRTTVCSTMEEVFRNDKKGEVSFTIVKQINHFLKTKKKGNHQKVHEDVLMPLLSLKLYHLSNNQLTENESYQKAQRPNTKGLSKKNKHLVEPIISKKEKKRAKERSKLDRELLEAKGEESAQTRLRYATDITNLLFAIYFRILKGFIANQTSCGIKLLHPVLNGLAKFGHLMSIEYFQDVLSAFKVLIGEESTVPIKNYEKLLCLKTVFAILGGQGDHLTLDPARFYTILNHILLRLDLNNDDVHATVQDREYFAKSRQSVLALSVLRDALIVRRKKVSKSTVAAIIKSVSIAMLQLSSDATQETIKFIRECLFVAHPQLSNLIVLEGEAEEDGLILPASGVHLPATGENDPFGIGNGQSLLWEAALLADHVSPQVSEAVTEVLAKKTVKPRKRPSPLSKPSDVHLDDVEFDTKEFDENACFDILNPNLPEMVVTARKQKKMN